MRRRGRVARKVFASNATLARGNVGAQVRWELSNGGENARSRQIGSPSRTQVITSTGEFEPPAVLWSLTGGETTGARFPLDRFAETIGRPARTHSASSPSSLTIFSCISVPAAASSAFCFSYMRVLISSKCHGSKPWVRAPSQLSSSLLLHSASCGTQDSSRSMHWR